MTSLNTPPYSWKCKLQNLSSLWVIREFVIILKLALPIILAFILTNLAPFVTIIFAGHISIEEKYLDGSSIAISFANVTGSALSVGLSSGLETLCSQSYGAKQYKRSGLYFQRSLLVHFLICFPLAVVWMNTETIMLLLAQDTQVAKVAGDFMTIYAVSLPAIQVSFLALKLFQSHNIVFPQIIVILVSLLSNAAIQYLLVVYFQFGIPGSAAALTISQYVLALGYILYFRFSHLYHETWNGWGIQSLKGWSQYLKYGIPGMLMLCFEWWSFESGYFSVGAFSPYPKIELGIYSVVLTFATILYSIAEGFTIASTVRVGNLLGSNQPRNAKHTSFLLYAIIFTTGSTQCVLLFLVRGSLARIFTDDICIIAGSAWPIAVVAIFQIIDGYQSVAGGVIKGCGKQKYGAIINVITFQVISLPLAFYLAFGLKWYTSGFWVGLAIGIFLHAIGYSFVLLCVNWQETAYTAMKNAGLTIDTNVNESDNKESFRAKKLMYSRVPNSQSSDSNESATETEELDKNTLEQSEEFNASKEDETIGKKEATFLIAFRSLTLLLCVLFLTAGIILRQFDFSFNFYKANSAANSSFCPYIA